MRTMICWGSRQAARSSGKQHLAVFSYNGRSELAAATLGTDAYAYDYDNIGNRKTAREIEEEFAYTANELNQYTSIEQSIPDSSLSPREQPFVPTYDADGNQTKIRTATGVWTAEYNALNRPVRFTRTAEDGTVTTVTGDYDYMGRRIFKKVETTVADPETGESTTSVILNHRYLYRGHLQIAALDLTRTTLNALWYILWDPTEPVATRPLAIQTAGSWFVYGWDLTKNVMELYKSNGTIANSYSYAPFGEVTQRGNITNPLQWSSEVFDGELGLVYYNYRHYTPHDGKWTTRDPIGIEERFNLYVFVNNDISKIDILGLEPYHMCILLSAKEMQHGDVAWEFGPLQGRIITKRSCKFRCYHNTPNNCYNIPCWSWCQKDHGVEILVFTLSKNRKIQAPTCASVAGEVQMKILTSGKTKSI